MTAHLLLLSHAATASTRLAGFPLDDEPLALAAESNLTALRGCVRHSDRRLVSPIARAALTAVALGLNATPEPALADCDFGRWRGWTLLEAQERDPEGVAAWLSDPASAPHGGESIVALIARVGAWLGAQGSIRGVTLAVTHAAVVRAAIVAALEIELAPSGASTWRRSPSRACQVMQAVGTSPALKLSKRECESCDGR